MQSTTANPAETFRLPNGRREGSTSKPRVAVLLHRIGPYHFARLRGAGACMEVTAVEASNVDPTYAWDEVRGNEKFARRMLFSGTSIETLSAQGIVETVESTLESLRPDAVAIPGWCDRCGLAALNWCARHSVPVIIMSESNAWDDARKPWRELVKKRVVQLCSAGLVGGSSHANYLEQLGMPQDRIFAGYDVVDNEYFERGAEQSRNQKVESGNRSCLPEKYFLASARFVEKKNLKRLIEAYSIYRKKAETGKQKAEIWSLVLLGDGPLKSALSAQLSTLNLHDHVLMPGFKQYDELPVYYGLASAFVHPSTTEQWGLVVNEAMASGLPVLVSSRCGCAQDLVREGVNGFSFDPLNVEQLAALMLEISASSFPLSAFGSASREIISHWSPDRFANGLQQAVEVALKNPLPRNRLLDRMLLRLLLVR